MSMFSRVIFQRGIDIRCDERGVWRYAAADPSVECPMLQAIIQEFGVLPVLAYQRGQNQPDFPLLLPKARGNSFGVQLTGLSQDIFHNPEALFDTLQIQNVVGAVQYHCTALAERYGNVVTSYYETWSRIPNHQMNDEQVNFGNQHEFYYEFEALITAAKRAYDATRYLLWREFGPGKGSIPSSFDRTIKNLPGLTVPLRSRLELSCRTYYAELKIYRDCIQHYVPLGGAIPYAALKRKHGVWTISAWIPDNPEAQSAKKFSYKLKRDALDYGWAVTDELFAIVKAIVAAVRTAPEPMASMR